MLCKKSQNSISNPISLKLSGLSSHLFQAKPESSSLQCSEMKFSTCQKNHGSLDSSPFLVFFQFRSQIIPFAHHIDGWGWGWCDWSIWLVLQLVGACLQDNQSNAWVLACTRTSQTGGRHARVRLRPVFDLLTPAPAPASASCSMTFAQFHFLILTKDTSTS